MYTHMVCIFAVLLCGVCVCVCGMYVYVCLMYVYVGELLGGKLCSYVQVSTDVSGIGSP